MGLFGKILAAPFKIVNAPIKAVETVWAWKMRILILCQNRWMLYPKKLKRLMNERQNGISLA
jgi:hypothetical protein